MKGRRRIRAFAGWVILAVLIVVFSVASDKFFTVSNLITILRQVSLLGIASVGLMYVMLTGCIDLSVGAQMSLTGMILAVCMSALHLPLWLCIAIALLSGAAMGYLNGIAVTVTRIPSLLVTLATTSVFSGLAYLISGGNPIYDIDTRLLFLGQGRISIIPTQVLILAAVLGCSAFVLGKTYWGKYICAVGSNENAARVAGVHADRIRRVAYLFCGVMAAIAGIITVSRINSAQPSAGLSFQLDTLTVCAVGGISMRGGEGKVINVFIGILIIGVLTNGLGIVGTSKYLQNVIQGLVFLLAVGIDYVRRGPRNASREPESTI